MAQTKDSRIFTPLTFLPSIPSLSHRIALAPMTRMRIDPSTNTPLPFVKDYYAQRACVPGTLLFTEGLAVAERHIGFAATPGIWNAEQVSAWKEVVDAVHKKKGVIVAQLFAYGRGAPKDMLAERGFDVVGPSAIAIKGEGFTVPRAMEREEVWELVADFVCAARNAVEAGFDAVEIHGGHGYLLHQFIDSNANQREDEFGGSIVNRGRLILGVVKAVSAAIGKERIGVRLTPFTTFQDMSMLGMPGELKQYTYLVEQLNGMQIGFLSLVEPRTSGSTDAEPNTYSIEPLIVMWNPHRSLVLGGGFTLDRTMEAVEQQYVDRKVVIAFGRQYTSNPDLVCRLKQGCHLTAYDRSSFYGGGEKGYVDWPVVQQDQSGRADHDGQMRLVD